MPTITTSDGTEIFYKDWGSGQPVVFSHGWPLSADDWDTQMLFLLHNGYRVVAHDRRGHGRSSQTADGHDMDHYADDLAALTAHLDLRDAFHVGHSTGGGEVVHYIARHGEDRVAKAAIVAAVPIASRLIEGRNRSAGACDRARAVSAAIQAMKMAAVRRSTVSCRATACSHRPLAVIGSCPSGRRRPRSGARC